MGARRFRDYIDNHAMKEPGKLFTTREGDK